jgi:RNA polymerase sigma-70 factor (ECF subfamily)
MTNSETAHSRRGDDDEASIVRRIVAGDRSAFELLMRRHNRRLYRLARAILRNDTEAEDALQEAYLSAYRSIGLFGGDAALPPWVSRRVQIVFRGRRRRAARRQNVIPISGSNSEPEMHAMPARDADLPDEILGRAQMRALLERKLDELPESFRVAFVLREIEEMTVEETAECLGVPEATVRSRHFRARSLLREALAHEMDLAEREVYEFGGANCDRVIARVMARLG